MNRKKSTALKLLEGNPSHESKESLRESVKPDGQRTDPIEFLIGDPVALQLWDDTVNRLCEQGKWDSNFRVTLAGLCKWFSVYVCAMEATAQAPMIKKGSRKNTVVGAEIRLASLAWRHVEVLAPRFGLTPRDLEDLGAFVEGEDELDAWMREYNTLNHTGANGARGQ